jgi:hypothetical protein
LRGERARASYAYPANTQGKEEPMTDFHATEFESEDQIQHSAILGAILAGPLAIVIITYGDWHQLSLAATMTSISLGAFWWFNRMVLANRKNR